jgi:outer membrane protein OmpA-like peptidoglycan-associated protein
MNSLSGMQTTEAWGPVQAARPDGARAAGLHAVARYTGPNVGPNAARTRAVAVPVFALGLVALLSGCASVPASINPVSWWHNLEGGAIAEQRPPPPGATDPYPNLASVPPKPKPSDPAAQQAIADGLIADRAHAQYQNAAAPIPDPSSRTASPGLFGVGTAALPVAPGAPRAALSAASAPPAPATPPSSPSRAPRSPVASSPLAPPPEAPAANATAPDATEVASLPPLPTVPPPPPVLPGIPAPPPVASAPPPPAPPPPVAQGSTAVLFPAGSPKIAPSAEDMLHGFAAKRGNAAIAVTGYGEAASDSPDAQSAAMALALARAQAITAVLTASGVPASAVVIDAQAAGRGGAVRLVN